MIRNNVLKLIHVEHCFCVNALKINENEKKERKKKPQSEWIIIILDETYMMICGHFIDCF